MTKTQERFDAAAVRQEADREWEGLTITSDPIFGEVMKEARFCLPLLRRALPDLAIERVELIRNQEQIFAGLGNHDVRFDIYVKGEDAKQTLVLEMQRANEYNLPWRLRTYQQMQDQGLLPEGVDYSALKYRPAYLVFLCAFDYFGYGDAHYQFENRNTFRLNQPLGDGRRIDIYNARAKNFKHAEPMRPFLEYMCDIINFKDEFIRDVHARVEEIKRNAQKKEDFIMDVIRYKHEMWQERQGGLEVGMRALVKNLDEVGLPTNQIVERLAQSFDLTKDEAERVYHEMLVH